MINPGRSGEEEKRSIPYETDRSAAQRDECAGNGMSIAPTGDRQSQLVEADAGYRDEREHGGQRHDPEDNSNRHHESRTLLRRRVHEQGYQRLARPKNENNKYRPGCYRMSGSLVMHVRVFIMMVMFMIVHDITMSMYVTV